MTSSAQARPPALTLGGAAAVVFLGSLCLGLLLPIYTDEVGWRFQARFAIDGVDRFIGESCGPNTLARPPMFMWPARYASAAANLMLADPLFVRLAGVFWALVWASLFWTFAGRLGRSAHERDLLRAAGFALVGLGVLPMLMVWSRPEQPLLLALTTALVLAAGRWGQGARREESLGSAGVKAAAVLAAGALAMSYHLKGVVYLPVFVVCAAMSSGGVRGRWARLTAAAILVALGVAAARYWVARFQCPANPLLSAALVRENLIAALLSGEALPDMRGALLDADPLRYIYRAGPMVQYMSDWLPRGQVVPKAAFWWGEFVTQTAWWIGLATGCAAWIMGVRCARRLRKWEPRLLLAPLLMAVLAAWGFSQLNKNVYESALALPAAMLAVVLALRSADLSPQALRRAQWVAVALVTISVISQFAVAILYARPLLAASRNAGYVAGQPFSISAYGYGRLAPQVTAAGRLCGVPQGRAGRAILVDDLTYFAYMDSWRPLHRLGVLSNWNHGISDPLAWLAARGSSGVVVGCAYLSPDLRRKAKSVGPFCCLGARDFAPRP